MVSSISPFKIYSEFRSENLSGLYGVKLDYVLHPHFQKLEIDHYSSKNPSGNLIQCGKEIFKGYGVKLNLTHNYMRN